MSISDETLIEELHRLADERNRTPSIQDLREHGAHSATTYIERFGSWQAALQAAGFEPREPETKIPKDDLLEELQRVAGEIGEAPSAAEMNEHGRYWASTYRRRFDSWNEALQAAGLEPTEPSDPVDEDDLLAELRRLEAELDEPPSMTEMDEEGAYSPNTYVRRFGSWSEAIAAAGFESAPSPGETTDEELLEELHRLADELGHKPSYSEMNNEGDYAGATYQRHFGSWSAALAEAFGKS